MAFMLNTSFDKCVRMYPLTHIFKYLFVYQNRVDYIKHAKEIIRIDNFLEHDREICRKHKFVFPWCIKSLSNSYNFNVRKKSPIY